MLETEHIYLWSLIYVDWISWINIHSTDKLSSICCISFKSHWSENAPDWNPWYILFLVGQHILHHIQQVVVKADIVLQMLFFQYGEAELYYRIVNMRDAHSQAMVTIAAANQNSYQVAPLVSVVLLSHIIIWIRYPSSCFALLFISIAVNHIA